MTAQEINKKIAEMCADVDDDPAIPKGDHEWRKGYKQACSDIIAMLHECDNQQLKQEG